MQLQLNLNESIACKGCGEILPLSVLLWGYCPACEDHNLCNLCKKECDLKHGLCPDCLEYYQKEIKNEDFEDV